MRARHGWAAAAALVLAAAAAPAARGALPPPLDPGRFAFPGAVASPGSAASAGLALADRWLGDEPGDNPAVTPWHGAAASPMALRVSRQDLAGANRDFHERSGSVDAAGGYVELPGKALLVCLYVTQPALRLENSSYTVGTVVSSGPSASSTIDASLREIRPGLALSVRRGAWRVGAAFEWTHREDEYQSNDVSGDPGSGTHDLAFSGDAAGGALGVRWERDPERAGGLVVGASVRATGAIALGGQTVAHLLVGDETDAVAGRRAAMGEGGASARWTLRPEAHVYASVAAHGGESFSGLDSTATVGGGALATSWAAGIDYRDPESPLGVRLGVGQESQPGTPEPRSGLVGFGVAVQGEGLTLDLGLLHRALSRTGRSPFRDDRVVATLRVAF